MSANEESQHRFVGLGNDIFLYAKPSLKSDRRRQVLWGDYLNVVGPAEVDGWLKVCWARRSDDEEELYVLASQTETERPLEIVFVDVGQGDGAILITPEHGAKERVLVVDAGQRDHMHDFLLNRFGSYVAGEDAGGAESKDQPIRLHAAVVTHCDEDHYGGFEKIFEHQAGTSEESTRSFAFERVYHNGLCELRDGATFKRLGRLERDPDRISELPEDHAKFVAAYEGGAGNTRFRKVARSALNNPDMCDAEFRMLSTEHGEQRDGRSHVPGFAKGQYAIEVLGPVPERHGESQALSLRKLGSYGETKNGHSVVLRLVMDDFSVLFGGDLNTRSESYLLEHYGDEMAARFGSVVFKVCHHGSNDSSDEFLDAVHASAFVISSGDGKGYVHPRPDMLGRLGKHAAGAAPLLLSTELQRSTREEAPKIVERLKKLVDTGSTLGQKELDSLKADLAKMEPAVDIWGSIYVKTDGKRLITAFKKEKDAQGRKWFYYEYTFQDGELQLVPPSKSSAPVSSTLISPTTDEGATEQAA